MSTVSRGEMRVDLNGEPARLDATPTRRQCPIHTDSHSQPTPPTRPRRAARPRTPRRPTSTPARRPSDRVTGKRAHPDPICPSQPGHAARSWKPGGAPGPRDLQDRPTTPVPHVHAAGHPRERVIQSAGTASSILEYPASNSMHSTFALSVRGIVAGRSWRLGGATAPATAPPDVQDRVRGVRDPNHQGQLFWRSNCSGGRCGRVEVSDPAGAGGWCSVERPGVEETHAHGP
jgi:hypothetical protein